MQRHSSLGLFDPSAVPLPEASLDDLNPLERERLRQIVDRYGGDQALLSLSDEELDGVLGFTVRQSPEGPTVPTLTGLLLVGRETSIRRLVPTHEVAFQVLEGTDVKVNDFYRAPLLRVLESFLDRFSARVVEEEIQVGLFRVPVPSYDMRAFREAIVNALVHRDYTRLGAVHVRLDDDGLSISNPGGFVEGVNLQNLLTVEPRPRNPRLADVIKRVGLSERTGRGVDLIYEGLLRYGRPAPDYSRSDRYGVVLRMSNAAADTEFLRMVVQEEERTNTRLPLDALLVLSRLREERRLGMATLSEVLQKSESRTRSILERLVEAGMVEARGSGRGRTYILSAQVYQRAGDKSRYVRQAGFDAIQQRQMVLQFLETQGKIKRSETAELCRISPYQATRLLNPLRPGKGHLLRAGSPLNTCAHASIRART
jgi:ATP-dependent DNA helicase RecG